MGLIPSGWYAHPIVRAIMRGIRASVALSISAVLIELSNEPYLIAVAPVLLAIDKFFRDHPPVK